MAETEQALSKRLQTMCNSSATVALLAVGHEVGFYRELAMHGPLTLPDLAKATSTVEVYVREWLMNQLAAGLISSEPSFSLEAAGSSDHGHGHGQGHDVHDHGHGHGHKDHDVHDHGHSHDGHGHGHNVHHSFESYKFYLNDAQKNVLFDESSHFFGTDYAYLSSAISHSCITNMPTEIRAGKGLDAVAHHRYFTLGGEILARRHRSDSSFSLVQYFGTEHCKLLEEGKKGRPAIILDLGCGSGYSLRTISRAYPRALCLGIDCNPVSIQLATDYAKKEGLEARCVFHVASALNLLGPAQIPELVQSWPNLLATSFPGSTSIPVPEQFDFVLMFNSLHDMHDPLRVLKNVQANLAPGGILLVSEPGHGDHKGDHEVLVGIHSAVSFAVWLPNAPAGTETPMGHHADDSRYFELAKQAGFSGVRTAPGRVFIMSN